MPQSADHSIRKAWNQALTLLDLKPSHTQSRLVVADLLRRYAEPHRCWHTSDHIQQMLDCIVSWRHQPEPALLLATLFHDAIYQPGALDNEVCSARLAQRQLSRIGVPAAVIRQVDHLILATRTHSPVADPDTALFLDADMAILGAESGLYEYYSTAIRQEHEQVSRWRYRLGRMRFLIDSLLHRRLFQTAQGKALQSRARKNMLRELMVLLLRGPAMIRLAQQTRLTLSTGTACELIEPGSHWVPGYQVLVCGSAGNEPQPVELEELAALAVRHARQKAQQVLGSADDYLLIQSGPGVRRKHHYHCHLIPLSGPAGKARIYLFLALKNWCFVWSQWIGRKGRQGCLG